VSLVELICGSNESPRLIHFFLAFVLPCYRHIFMVLLKPPIGHSMILKVSHCDDTPTTSPLSASSFRAPQGATITITINITSTNQQCNAMPLKNSLSVNFLTWFFLLFAKWFVLSTSSFISIAFVQKSLQKRCKMTWVKSLSSFSDSTSNPAIPMSICSLL
jgi:hypothetical protein